MARTKILASTSGKHMKQPDSAVSVAGRKPKTDTKMRQFNGMDSLFLYMDAAHAGMHGAFLQIYAPVKGEDAATRYKRLLMHIEHHLDASPVFRRAIVISPMDLDHAWWADGVTATEITSTLHSNNPRREKAHHPQANHHTHGPDVAHGRWGDVFRFHHENLWQPLYRSLRPQLIH